MKFADAFLTLQYGPENERPLPIPVQVDLSGLTPAERLLLSEKRTEDLETQVEQLRRNQWDPRLTEWSGR